MSLYDIEGLIDKGAITNLIVIGDDQYEMEAGQNFRNQSQNCLAKQIKLRDNPTAEELEKQLEVVNNNFRYIISSFKSLNLKLEVSKNEQ